MASLKEQLQVNMTEIDHVVEMFYQQKSQEAYLQLDVVLGNFSSVIDNLFSYQQEHPELELDIESLVEALKEALSALEEKDAILVADVLKYELLEKMEGIVAVL
jgi:KaiC/GvpD/RAD55 family RecA-like ATPase